MQLEFELKNSDFNTDNIDKIKYFIYMDSGVSCYPRKTTNNFKKSVLFLRAANDSSITLYMNLGTYC